MLQPPYNDIGYALMIFLGIVCCLIFIEAFFRKNKAEKGCSTSYEILTLASIIIGFIFALLFQNLYDYIEDPASYSFSWGMTFYGGFIGGIITFLGGYYIFIKKKYPGSFSLITSISGSAICVAHGLGRVGCFLAGCCYGKPTDSIWGMKFYTTSVKVWPVNLYEAIFLLILASVLFYLAYRKDFRYGLPIYMISYGLFRFFIEYLRGDHRGSFIPGLTPSQFWSILLFIGGIGLGLFFFLSKRTKKAE